LKKLGIQIMTADIRESVATGAEKRLEKRVAATLPVTLGDLEGIKAVTRDVSASGLFLETDAVLTQGSLIRLMVELDTPRGKRVLRCEGSVVRMETLDDRLGFAVKIVDSRLERPFDRAGLS
jgi:hypothetical protein